MLNRCHFLISSFVFTIGTIKSIECLAAFEITYSEKNLKKLLTPAQFTILCKWKTERPFPNSFYSKKSDLLKEDREGTYNYVGCDLPLYESKTKYDSGTGWPSFLAPIIVNVDYGKDWYFAKLLTEAHCNRCGGHLGHIFDDEPKPIGKRHCINGLAVIFRES